MHRSRVSLFPYNDPGQLPITPLRHPDGEWLRLKITLPGYAVWLRAWQAQVGRVKLYLLDSNDAAIYPAYRGITSELYGGGAELRLQQELLLGIGGWRLLAALGVKPEVCHLNEGHAAFAVVERARDFMTETRQSFAAALAATRVGNLFTTHTAVDAGFDRFAPDLITRFLKIYTEQTGIDVADVLALGRRDPLTQRRPRSLISTPRATARVTSGTCGPGDSSRSTLCLPGGRPVPARGRKDHPPGPTRKNRLKEYFGMGARFAKWRAVIAVGAGIPSRGCIEVSAHELARYAALCQEAELVPIVELEVLMDGEHTLAQCREATEEVLQTVFHLIEKLRALDRIAAGRGAAFHARHGIARHSRPRHRHPEVPVVTLWNATSSADLDP